MTVAGRFVDFYALLSIAPDAPTEAVGEAIAEQRRRWEASSASTAEERVRELDLAELVLLDPEQRADYDDEWRSRSDGVAPVPEQTADPPGQPQVPEQAADPLGQPQVPEQAADPLGQPQAPEQVDAPDGGDALGGDAAGGHAAGGDVLGGDAPGEHAAGGDVLGGDAAGGHAVGGDALAGNGKSGDAWAEQARRAAASGDHARAIDSFHYAVLLQPENPALHYELGQAYARAGNYELAYGGFDSAARLAPHVTAYRAALGRALVHLGRPGDAIGVLEQVVAETPTEATYRYDLAQALHDTCVHEMTLLNDGMVCITSADQARLVERLTGRALSLLDPHDRGELAGDVREKYELARLAMRRTWRPPLPWWVMIAVTAAVVLILGALIHWWAGAIALVLLTAAVAVLGMQPTWWHVAKAARESGQLGHG